VINHREASKKYQQKRFEHGGRTPARSIDWEKADKLIQQGMTDKQVADICHCSPWSIYNRRYQTRAAMEDSRRIVAEPHYNYKAALDAMIAKLHKARGNGMDMEQFRKWLMTPPGQYVLASINEALRKQEGWEQRFVEYTGGGWKAKTHQGNA
jgi:hypothetical protein